MKKNLDRKSRVRLPLSKSVALHAIGKAEYQIYFFLEQIQAILYGLNVER